MIKVLVVFGSISSEHEISCISAGNILENIDMNKYSVTKLGIDKQGEWFVYNGLNVTVKENKWIQDNSNKEKIIDIFGELKKHDVIFPIMHGKFGEDGSIQGLFELLKLKYVGCDMEGSAIAMDKILSKQLVSTAGINIVDYIYLDKYSKLDLNVIVNDLNINGIKFPVIVKPNKEGSSYGVTKVNNKDELVSAIKFALEFDDKVLVEKYIQKRREIECSVLGNNDLTISTPGEIISANEFYDFDGKYNNTKSTSKIPADISIEDIYSIKEYSEKIFKVLNLKSISRVDFFIDEEDNKIYFNEVNTMPGFTSISMYPKMLEHDGIKYSEIIDKLIELALE